MESPPQTLLLITDISGFTRFMRLHPLSTSHARQIIVRLLKALINASSYPLKVAELEGDAVFFFAPIDARAAAAVKAQMLRFFQVFEKEIEALERVKACVCGACTSVAQLRLKQVVHTGEVSVEKIDRFEKLFGLDVIVVHRMLKNSVQSDRYILTTRSAHDLLGGIEGLQPLSHAESFEGIGSVETLLYDDAMITQALQATPAPMAAASRSSTWRWKLEMHLNTLLQFLGRPAPSPLSGR